MTSLLPMNYKNSIDCDLNLRLSSADTSESSSSNNSDEESTMNSTNLQRLTIFYDGRACVCDVTEMQVKAILYLAGAAKRERSERVTPCPPPPSSSPDCKPQQRYAQSMKRSLQKFLQKRKKRIEEASPYKLQL